MFRNEIENEKDEWWFRGKDVVTYIQNYKGMKNVKRGRDFDELKKWVQTIWLSGLISLLVIKVFGV